MTTSQFDFDALKQEIITASLSALSEIIGQHPDERICAFALYSDEGAMTVCPAINTAEHLLKCQNEHPQYALDYKFSPAEWKCEAEGANKLFDVISEKVSVEVGKDDIKFATFRRNLFATCGQALVEVKQEITRTNLLNDPILLLFSVSDSDISRQQIQLTKALNDSITWSEFKKWSEN